MFFAKHPTPSSPERFLGRRGKNIIHRDLKPENILLSESALKFCSPFSAHFLWC